jgi:ArsR family transcriptional regulator, arsenate/arsenite/antimonite-responsive transcriptional repressor
VPESSDFSRIEMAECDSTVVSEPIAARDAERAAPLLAALGDPARLRLMSAIAGHARREACICDLDAAFGLGEEAVAEHLDLLVGAGLIERVQHGVWGYYRVRTGVLSDLVGVTAGMTR